MGLGGGASRPFTKLAIAILFALLVAAAVIQLVLASGNRPRFPGPVPGTPLPSLSPSV